ncbi:M23 family metallopeptidase [Agromyces seonyuensis]|uniref:M23 family metallopeptidase n=1 Tax=Agromyces seonyuensis TaxID=2662446 RepID=UPI00301428FB
MSPPIRVRAPYRAPEHPYGPGHRGIDLDAAFGSEVRAPASGVVSFAGMVAGRPVVSITHGDGIVSSFEPVAGTLAAGDEVAAGAVIGTVGTVGHCEDCVHLGVRVDGVYVSPLVFLGGLPRAVLLPLE